MIIQFDVIDRVLSFSHFHFMTHPKLHISELIVSYGEIGKIKSVIVHRKQQSPKLFEIPFTSNSKKLLLQTILLSCSVDVLKDILNLKSGRKNDQLIKKISMRCGAFEPLCVFNIELCSQSCKIFERVLCVSTNFRETIF